VKTWLAGIAIFVAAAWVVAAVAFDYGFREGQRTQDAAYGLKLDKVLEFHRQIFDSCGLYRLR
jgi:hypothetical protein